MASNNSLGSWVFTIGLLCLGGYFRGSGDSNNVNKPKGAIEYFESQDGSQKVILYPDRLVAKGFGSRIDSNDRRDFEFPIYDIRNVSKAGQKIKINTTSGQLELQFNSLIVGDARQLKESIDKLIRKR
jgi:hypothetical protein